MKSVKKMVGLLYNILGLPFNTIKWSWKKLKSFKFKGILIWIFDVIKESIAQIFTLLGFFIAWFTLTGTAQDIVGIAIIISTAVWLLTIRLRD